MINSEKFSQFASGFQSIVVAVAIILGGVWSAYTFNVLGQRSRAQVELRKIQDEINRTLVVQIPTRTGDRRQDKRGAWGATKFINIKQN